MVVDKEMLTIKETYKLEDNDELEIKSKGNITEICVNGTKIEFVLAIDFNLKPGEMVEIKVERAFTQKDFDKIKDYYE